MQITIHFNGKLMPNIASVGVHGNFPGGYASLILSNHVNFFQSRDEIQISAKTNLGEVTNLTIHCSDPQQMLDLAALIDRAGRELAGKLEAERGV